MISDTICKFSKILVRYSQILTSTLNSKFKQYQYPKDRTDLFVGYKISIKPILNETPEAGRTTL